MLRRIADLPGVYLQETNWHMLTRRDALPESFSRTAIPWSPHVPDGIAPELTGFSMVFMDFESKQHHKNA